MDVLPDEVAQQMADSAARNKLIVETYKAKQNDYGQTILFAVNVVHAIQLTSLFKKLVSKLTSSYLLLRMPLLV